MRKTGSAQASFDRMTIPENDEFLGSAHKVSRDSSFVPTSTSSLSSASVTSLFPVNGVPPQQTRNFRRSQTGIQLLPNKIWSRYAAPNFRQASLDSSSSSIISTTCSNETLLPAQNSVSNIKNESKNFVSSCSIFGSDKRQNDETNKRPKSGNFIEDNFINLYSSEDESDKLYRGYSVWQKPSSSTNKQSRQVIMRSSSMGRLNTDEKFGSFTLGPPFFSYKVLPYIWIGNMKSADCGDLLSDGGSQYETRLIRRRVYIDFGVEKNKPPISWPQKRPNTLDYMIPLPRRTKSTKKLIFLGIVEFCKIVNKARGDATQVLAYGNNIDLAQYFTAAYLMIMFKKTPQSAVDFVSRTRIVNLPEILLNWLYDLFDFLDRKSIDLGRLEGDIINVTNLEADRQYSRKHVIIRGDEVSTPNYAKFINVEINTTHNVSLSMIPLPFQVPADQRNTFSDNI